MIADEDAGLEVFFGGGISAFEFEIEVFYPDHAVGEGPGLVFGVGDEIGGVFDGEPALLEGVVGPEGEVDIVGDDAGVWGEGGEV